MASHYHYNDLIESILLDESADNSGDCPLENIDTLYTDGDNWNERFQFAISLPENTDEERLLKYTLLTSVNRDFIATAETYAKTVISEFFLPLHLKSVKVGEDFGGLAGGKKYFWRGILFKLADGGVGPYEGSDEAAAKAMGHDLRGAIHYSKCGVPGLSIALQALIDFKGFRMCAQAYLPLDHSTLKVGTSDACATCPRSEDEELLGLMARAGKELRLKPHRVAGVTLYSGCDVEGHRGKDGRCYIIDCARVFPPECPLVAAHLIPSRCIGYLPNQLVQYQQKGGSTPKPGSLQKATAAQACIQKVLGEGKYIVVLQEGPTEGAVLLADHSELSPCHMSIFWRLLRPEFVKNRGSTILEKKIRRSASLAHAGAGNPLSTRTHSEDTSPCPSIDLCQQDYALADIATSLKLEAEDGSVTLHSNKEDSYLPTESLLPLESFGSFTAEVGEAIDTIDKGLPQGSQSMQNHTSKYGRYSYGASEPLYYPFIAEKDDPYEVIGAPKGSPTLSHQNSKYTRYSFGANEPAYHPFLVEEEENTLGDLPRPGDLKLTPMKGHLATDIQVSGNLNLDAPPLSSDGFSSFVVGDSSHQADNAELQTATRILVEKVIPAVAVDLVEMDPKEAETVEIADFLHSHGVNLRHMGLLRSKILSLSTDMKTENAKDGSRSDNTAVGSVASKLLLEMVSRTLKNLIKESQRTWMKRKKTTSEEGMHRLIARCFNFITGSHPEHLKFWQDLVVPEIQRRYGEVALTEEERMLLSEICGEGSFMHRLMDRVQAMVGVRLTEESREQFRESAAVNFEFLAGDVEQLVPIVKHMHLVDYGEGIVLNLLAQQREKAQCDNHIVDRLGNLACNRFHRALKAVPDDLRTRHLLADSYQARAFALRDKDIAESQRCFERFQRLRVDDTNTRCTVSGASYKDEILGVVIRVHHKKATIRNPLKSVAQVQVVPNHRDTFQIGSPDPSNPYRHPNYQDFNDVSNELEHEDVISLSMFLHGYSKKNRKLRENMEKTCQWYNTKDPMKLKHYEQFFPYRFLPLVVDEDHGNRVLKLLEEEISRMKSLSFADYELPVDGEAYMLNPADLSFVEHPSVQVREFSPQDALDIVANMMNSLVLLLVSKCSHGDGEWVKPVPAPARDQTVSDEALLLYCRFHHMLLFLARQHPEMCDLANDQVKSFLERPDMRTKKHTSNLGEFIIYLLLSDQGWEGRMKHAFVSEVLDRNVSWFIQDKSRWFPELVYLETDEVCHYRLHKTFLASLTSLRIVMFQVYFISGVGRRDSCSQESMLHLYNSSYGRPTAGMKEGLREAYDLIMNATSFTQYFDMVGVWYSPKAFSSKLRNAVRNAVQKGYLRETNLLKRLRCSEALEPVEEGLERAPASPRGRKEEQGLSWAAVEQAWEKDPLKYKAKAIKRGKIVAEHLKKGTKPRKRSSEKRLPLQKSKSEGFKGNTPGRTTQPFDGSAQPRKSKSVREGNFKTANPKQSFEKGRPPRRSSTRHEATYPQPPPSAPGHLQRHVSAFQAKDSHFQRYLHQTGSSQEFIDPSPPPPWSPNVDWAGHQDIPGFVSPPHNEYLAWHGHHFPHHHGPGPPFPVENTGHLAGYADFPVPVGRIYPQQELHSSPYAVHARYRSLSEQEPPRETSGKESDG